MSQLTEHGENIAMQINDADAYGRIDILSYADVWNIIDQIHTHFMDTNRDTSLLEKWLKDIEMIDEDVPL